MPVGLQLGEGRRWRQGAIFAISVLVGSLAGCHAEPEPGVSVTGGPRKKVVVAKRESAKFAATVRLPDEALLRAPLPPSGCENSVPADPATQPAARLRQGELVPAQAKQDEHLATAIRLEYERECFKQSEARTREQLVKLQAAVRRTVKRAGNER